MNATDLYFFMYYMICLFAGLVLFGNIDYLNQTVSHTDNNVSIFSTSSESTPESALFTSTTQTTLANSSDVSSVQSQGYTNGNKTPSMTTSSHAFYENYTLKPEDISSILLTPFFTVPDFNDNKNMSQLKNPPSLNDTKLPELGVNSSGQSLSSGSVTSPVSSTTPSPIINSSVTGNYSQNFEKPNMEKNEPRQDFVLWSS